MEKFEERLAALETKFGSGDFGKKEKKNCGKAGETGGCVLSAAAAAGYDLVVLAGGLGALRETHDGSSSAGNSPSAAPPEKTRKKKNI